MQKEQREKLKKPATLFLEWLLLIVSLALGFAVFVSLRVFFEQTPYMVWNAISVLLGSLVATILFLVTKIVFGKKWQWKKFCVLVGMFLVLHTFLLWILVLAGVGTIGAWYTSGSIFLIAWTVKNLFDYKPKTKIDFSLTAGVAVIAILFFAVGAWIVQRALYIPPAVPISAKAPSSAQINKSLEKANHFLLGLYKDDAALPPSKVVENGTGQGLTNKAGTSAAISEYYGLPIRIRTERDPRYRLLGDTAVRVKQLLDGATSEISVVSFNLTRGKAPQNTGDEKDPYFSLSQYRLNQEVVFNAEVEVDWNYSKTQIALSFRSIQRTPPRTNLFVRLGNKPLGWWNTNNTGKKRTFLINKNSRELFQSFRYTTRHATQGGEYFFSYHQDKRADRLRKTLGDTGFPKGYDPYSPIWDQDQNFGLYDLWKSDNYQDCQNKPTRTRNAYLYDSKICRLPIDVYRWLAVPDSLLPTSLALHALHLNKDPDYKYQDLDKRPRTARSWARRLERLYRKKDEKGLVRCNPLQCEKDRFSTIRTAYFGALEAELGYKYGDKTSKTYADKIAQNMIRLQVKDTGEVFSTDRNVYYRPIQKGAFYSIYNGQFLNRETMSFVSEKKDEIMTALEMPREYMGVIPGNGETGFAVYGFLKKYRCLKYNIGCQKAPENLPQSNVQFKETDKRPYHNVFGNLLSPQERQLQDEPAAPSARNSGKSDKKVLDKNERELVNQKARF